MNIANKFCPLMISILSVKINKPPEEEILHFRFNSWNSLKD